MNMNNRYVRMFQFNFVGGCMWCTLSVCATECTRDPLPSFLHSLLPSARLHPSPSVFSTSSCAPPASASGRPGSARTRSGCWSRGSAPPSETSSSGWSTPRSAQPNASTCLKMWPRPPPLYRGSRYDFFCTVTEKKTKQKKHSNKIVAVLPWSSGSACA